MKNKLIIWDIERSDVVGEIVLAANVIDLKLRRDCIVAVLERKTEVYAIETLQKFACFNSYANHFGIAALSTDPSSLIIASPSLTN